MSTLNENRVAPSDFAPEEQHRLERMLTGEVRPALITEQGDVIELPKVINDLFVSIVQSIKQKQAVFIMHEDEAFTTQAAANFLGISRQYFVRLLEDDQLPFHFVGTHRRVLYKDLVAYRRNRSQKRRKGLDSMTDELVQAGVYDRYVPFGQEDSES